MANTSEATTNMDVYERMNRERETLPNQLAVVGFLILQRVEKRISILENPVAYDIVYEAKRNVWSDVNIAALTACWDFLIFDHDWK